MRRGQDGYNKNWVGSARPAGAAGTMVTVVIYLEDVEADGGGYCLTIGKSSPQLACPPTTSVTSSSHPEASRWPHSDLSVESSFCPVRSPRLTYVYSI